MNATNTGMDQDIDFLAIREMNDLRSVLENWLGQPDKNKKWLCPFHNEKTPSFTITPDGQHAKCFGTCGWYGDVIDFTAEMKHTNLYDAAMELGGLILQLPPDEMKERQEELKRQAQQRQIEFDLDRQEQIEHAVGRIGNMIPKVDFYHSQLFRANGFWKSQGLSDSTVDLYRLGYNAEYWVGKGESVPSFVIPYFHGLKNLVAIRHRLEGRDNDKYRPEFKGMPNQLFLGAYWQGYELVHDEIIFDSYLPADEGILLEGEIKTMYLSQHGLPIAGLPGLNAWQTDWLELFRHVTVVYLCLDPGIKPDIEKKQVARIATDLIGAGKRVIQVKMSHKPDDFFVVYGGTIDQFLAHLRWGRVLK